MINNKLDELRKAAWKLHARREVHGLAISVENRKGSTRRWYDPHGKESGSTRMYCDYGYIRGTEGTDGDHVDCYVGPNPKSTLVVLIDQMKKPSFDQFDEQKAMLGFDTAMEAKNAYLKQYDDPRFFGKMISMHVDRFKELVLKKKNHGERIHEMSKAAGHKYTSRKPDGKGGWNYDYAELHEHDVHLVTGKPATMKVTHRAQKTQHFGATYGQDIEPAGRYVVHGHHGTQGSSVEPGGHRVHTTHDEVHFKKPLVLKHGGTGGEQGMWKRSLSDAYGGKTGKALSRAIAADGYDAIVTADKYGTSEIVDLTSFHIKKAVLTLREITEALLTKSDAHKPPAGFTPIPNGTKGGYRKPKAGGWEYWYPHDGATLGGSHEPWTEKHYVDGDFDKEPLNWSEQPGATKAWTHGGVDPHSKHPVKYKGNINKLYQIVDAHARDGYAYLVDVKTGVKMLARHDRIVKVVHHGARKVATAKAPPTSQGPTWNPGHRESEPGFSEGGVGGVSGKRAPKFEGSNADATKQPGLHAIENGIYPLKSVQKNETDDDGVKRKSARIAIAVPDHGKHQLVAEFEALINKTAKQMQKRFNLRSAIETSRSGSVDLTLVDLRRAGVEGMLAAIERYDASGPFAATAQQFVRDYVRQHAAHEALGGVGLPARHQRNLGRYIAARAQAAAKLGIEDPTPDDVLPFFKLQKRHLHSDLHSDVGSQPVPVNDYALHSEPNATEIDTKTSPGLRSLATMYSEFLTGAKTSEEFSEDKYVFPALSMGTEGPEQRIIMRNAISHAMKELAGLSIQTEGRKKIEYTTDVSMIIERKLGLHGDNGEAWSDAEIAKQIPIFANGKRVSENTARALVADFVERGLARMKSAIDDDRTKSLIERAGERVLPPPVVVSGPTMWDKIAERAKSISADAVHEYRHGEVRRMRETEAKMRTRAAEDNDPVQARLADGLAEAARRAERMSDDEIRKKLAMRASPENAEMRRLMTQSQAVDTAKPGSYFNAPVSMTDLTTGIARPVSVRHLFPQHDDPRESMHKSDARRTLSSAQHYVQKFPRLMRLLFAPDDIGDAPTLARYITETLAGV